MTRYIPILSIYMLIIVWNRICHLSGLWKISTSLSLYSSSEDVRTATSPWNMLSCCFHCMSLKDKLQSYPLSDGSSASAKNVDMEVIHFVVECVHHGKVVRLSENMRTCVCRLSKILCMYFLEVGWRLKKSTIVWDCRRWPGRGPLVEEEATLLAYISNIRLCNTDIN